MDLNIETIIHWRIGGEAVGELKVLHLCASKIALEILLPSPPGPICDLKFSRSQAKLDENFTNYFLKTKA